MPLFYIIIHSIDISNFYSYQKNIPHPIHQKYSKISQISYFSHVQKAILQKKKKKFSNRIYIRSRKPRYKRSKNKNPPVYPRYFKKKKKKKNSTKQNKESLLLCFELLFHNPLKNDILAAQRSTRSSRTEIFPSIVIRHETGRYRRALLRQATFTRETRHDPRFQ